MVMTFTSIYFFWYSSSSISYLASSVPPAFPASPTPALILLSLVEMDMDFNTLLLLPVIKINEVLS
jgi:hypothetical protein